MQIGRYEVRDKLGGGTMAQVYRAYDPRLKREVAIKTLHTHWAQDTEVLTRFRDEATFLASLKHPNVIQVYEYVEEDGHYYMTMAYVANGTLTQVIKERAPLSETQAVELLAPIAEALEYAHGLGMVHRDIKPANILLDERNNPVLTDFGIARAIRETELTLPGSVVGTAYYMSPEQATGQPAGAAADIYALGIVLYEVLTQRRPFEGETVAVLNKQINEPPPSPRLIIPGLSKAMEAVVLKALAKKPEERFVSAGAFAQGMREALTGKMPLATVATAGHQRQLPVVGGVVAVMGVLMVLGLVMMQNMISPVATTLTAQATPVPAPEVTTAAPLAGVPVAPTPTALATVTPSPTVEATLDVDGNLAGGAETSTPTREASATPSNTPLPTATITATMTPTVGNSPTASATTVAVVNGNALVLNFEGCGPWRRGNELWGTLQCSSERANSGGQGGRLSYDFTQATSANDYVVFFSSARISGEPRSLGLMVYGDGSGHFLNLWIRDNGGQVWQVPLGTVSHTGWRQMNGALDTGQAWPWTTISGTDNGTVDYPIALEGLVLDAHPERSTRTSAIYLDDLVASSTVAYPVFGGGSGSVAVANPTATVATTGAPPSQPPTATLPPGVPTQPSLPTATPTLPPAPTSTVAPRPPIVVRDTVPWAQVSVNDLLTLTWDGGGPIGPNDFAYIRVFQNGTFVRNIVIPNIEWNSQNFFPFRAHQITGGTDQFGRFTVFIELVAADGTSMARSQMWDYEVGP